VQKFVVHKGIVFKELFFERGGVGEKKLEREVKKTSAAQRVAELMSAGLCCLVETTKLREMTKKITP
jgi:hypothetical protein